ncbi:MAG: T9SS type A sorting domain-containing protein [Ignavibacteriales bacterium]|nr:T9SS type A sorting domain-containing protein [Ignavibacteriales bacterium]
MKKDLTSLLTLMFFLVIGSVVFAQPTHTINFEPAGVGADWDWTVSENADNPPLEFIANPVSGGINTSPMVAKFIARQAGNPWALFFTDDDGQFTFDATNSTVKIMVWKPVISPVHFKVEGATGTPTELIGTNTVLNQWEEITFDFSSVIGNTYNRLVIIPDFLARSQDNTIYIDNIQVPDGQVTVIPQPTVHAPTPIVPASTVLSVFSDVYPDIPGTNLNPNWGQSTAVSFPTIQGDTTMRYMNLNYQGIELGSSQNLTSAGMLYLHIDFWNANSTDLGVYLISPGPVEARVSLVPPGTTETWVSRDILLSNFAPVDLTNVFQFKFDGNGTIYLDNIYFWSGIVPVELTSFTATVNNNDVQLIWKTATESNNSGFQIERKSISEYESIGFVAGSGTTTEPMIYSFSDVNLNPGTYYYRLKQIDYDGTFEYSDLVEIDIITPDIYLLHQNYPNPFNPNTEIMFSLASDANVILKIFDVLGQEVMTLINKYISAGVHTYDFRATGFNSGIYFYRIEANGNDGTNFIDIKKMILLK